MAYQGNRTDNGAVAAAGGAKSPTVQLKGGRPAHENYVKPTLDRGWPVIERLGPDGTPKPQQKYGVNQSTVPSSVGIRQSAELTDFSIDPPDHDDVLQGLIDDGFSDRSGELAQPIIDLERKISTSGVGDAFGMGSARSRQPSSHDTPKVPNDIDRSQAAPVRKPGDVVK